MNGITLHTPETAEEKKGLLKRLPLNVLIISIVFLGCIFLFGLIAEEAVLENEQVFDNKVFAFFGTFSSPGFIHLIRVFTFFGSANFLLPAYIVLITWFFIKGQFHHGLDVAIIALSSTALMIGLKHYFHRERPPDPIIQGITSASFPSGHSLSAFIFCSVLTYIIWNEPLRKPLKWALSILLVLFAITIGISRIALKVHYPTDVVASFCLGIVWVIISFWLMKKVNRTHLHTHPWNKSRAARQ